MSPQPAYFFEMLFIPRLFLDEQPCEMPDLLIRNRHRLDGGTSFITQKFLRIAAIQSMNFSPSQGCLPSITAGFLRSISQCEPAEGGAPAENKDGKG